MPTSLVIGCTLFIYLYWKQSPGALSIQKIFWFEISEIPRAQWNGTFRLHRPDPSHREFGYRSCKQDTNEPYRGQQFCEMKRDGPTDLKWTDGSNIPVGLQNGLIVPFDFKPDFRNFGLNGKRPLKVDYTSSWSVLTFKAALLLYTIASLLPRKTYKMLSWMLLVN